MAQRNRRRTVLKLIGVGLGGSTLRGSVAAEQGDSQSAYSIVQGDRCVPVTPLSSTTPVEEFYDYAPDSEHRYSSNGTVDLQRPDGSIVFLYSGPNGTSLVFVHGMLDGGGTGGSVSMDIFGLPATGEWVIEDDNYDAPSNYDRWNHSDTSSEIDWTWAGSRTDGGVFAGMTTDATVRIVPEFNQSAFLYGQYYDGDLTQWEFLSGDRSSPERIELAMDRPLVVRGGACPDTGGGSGGGGTGGGGTGGGGTGADGTSGGGTGGGGKGSQGKNERKKRGKDRTKHQRKQRKQRRKHRKKQRKHRKKHQKKQRKHREKRKKERRKHEKKQRKHEEKREKEREKHRKKQRKHRKKRRKKRRKHRKKQRKHEEKEEKEEEEEDD